MLNPAFRACPFCGDIPHYARRQDESLWSHKIVDWHRVTCIECDVEMQRCDDLEDLLDAWNTRRRAKR